jgi:hypothetical protein
MNPGEATNVFNAMLIRGHWTAQVKGTQTSAPSSLWTGKQVIDCTEGGPLSVSTTTLGDSLCRCH